MKQDLIIYHGSQQIVEVPEFNIMREDMKHDDPRLQSVISG